jgi:predicted ATPase/SAM-dependent methyltransferase
MRITSFVPSKEALDALGLENVRLSKLGQLVVLAGPNGGGKSRILQLLQQSATAEQNRIEARRNYKQQVKDHENALQQNALGNQPVEPHVLDVWRATVISGKAGLARLEAIVLETEVEMIRVVNFVPKRLNLQDPADLPRRELLNRAERAKNTGMDHLSEDALAYIQNKQDRWYEVTHPNFVGSDARIQIENEYHTLIRLIRALLGTELSRSADSEALLFGKPLGSCSLSDGQKVLLQFIVAVHPTHNDDALVLVMDEPENHLHPSALIAALERIQSALPRAQLWIATHSVPLLAHLYAREPDSLHFVERGTVTFAGTKPEIVLKGLLGDEDEQAKLLNFIDLPRSLASSRFAAACLVEPAVAEHHPGDVQLQQIRTIVTESRVDGGPLRILDFGAGKGRLLAGLVGDSAHTVGDIDYVAFDSSFSNKGACERQLSETYGSAERRWYSDPDKLFADHGEGTFDVVVMCNVLHEINPDDWLSILGDSGIVHKALSKRGALLIIEDLRVPVGELPNSRGFFLLDTIHLQKLFDVAHGPADTAIRSHDARGDDRLKAHVVSKDLVGRANRGSRIEAIKALQETSGRRLKELRAAGDNSFKAGQLYGLWSQQYTSCALYLQVI